MVTQDGKPVEGIAKSITVDRMWICGASPPRSAPGVKGWRVLVYNQKNPEALKFKGVAYFPSIRLSACTARFAPDAKLAPRVFRTSRGTDKQFFHAGDAVFTLKGRRITLPFYAESNDPERYQGHVGLLYRRADRQGHLWRGPLCRYRQFRKFPPARS